MTDPTITGAGIGGVIVATFWGITKLVPVIAKVVKPINSKGRRPKNNLRECYQKLLFKPK